MKKSWAKIYSDLDTEIKLRHYSNKTYKAYASWARQFHRFTDNKEPEMLTIDDVKSFLTYLAVDRKVSSSTQNQAFNSLLFLFRNILKEDYKGFDGVVRAKQRKYIPVVLSREETDNILEHLAYPYDLIVKLLYGCGLRLFECLQLRINHLNFDAMILTVHDGKGQKDRTVPIPEAVLYELKNQIDKVHNLHQKDIDSGYDGTFLFNALEKKYGITRDQYNIRLKVQEGVCKICGGTNKSGRALHVDHNHITGKVRALLCFRCNVNLRLVENKELLQRSLDYLKEYE